MVKKSEGAEAEDQSEEGAEEDGAGSEDAAEKPEAKLSKAEERASRAEARAEAAERKSAELESSRSQQSRSDETPANGYTLASFPEAEWAAVEAETGKDRKDILFSLNLQAKTDRKIKTAVGGLETKIAIREHVESLAADEPLYPKFRKEVDAFIRDIETELMSTPEGRKKWIGKAFEYAKRGVKGPGGSRRADGAPDTRETGKGKADGGKSHEYSESEKQIFAEHGKTAEDYDKIRDPLRPEGVVIKGRPDAPSFG